MALRFRMVEMVYSIIEKIIIGGRISPHQPLAES